MPAPSARLLDERLKSFRTRTGRPVVVLTLLSLDGEDIESFGRKAFRSIPLDPKELRRTVLLIVVRDRRQVAVQTGAELAHLFPAPAAAQNIASQVTAYVDGMRPDLGIHAGVHYIFGVIRGNFQVGNATEEERFEQRSLRGAGAGAIFALFFAPFLAFVVGMLWGVYATNPGAERGPRLFMGAVLGGGTAKIVEVLTSLIGGYSTGLWYFILIIGIALGVFGSLTEYWMGGGDWSGIPRIKDASLTRKPTDKIGI